MTLQIGVQNTKDQCSHCSFNVYYNGTYSTDVILLKVLSCMGLKNIVVIRAHSLQRLMQQANLLAVRKPILQHQIRHFNVLQGARVQSTWNLYS